MSQPSQLTSAPSLIVGDADRPLELPAQELDHAQARDCDDPSTLGNPADPGRPPFHLIAQGKVRDIYALDDEHLLLVASDRISAFDHVLPTPIPDKGRILTQLSAWWFEQLADIVPSHLISAAPAGIAQAWQGRTMLVRRLDMLGVECVARGYLTGSGLAQVRETGALAGVQLPRASVDGQRLERPLFTPATKAEVGQHDENITHEQVQSMLGRGLANELQRLTLAIYERGREIAAQRGIVLADTKLEFGMLAPSRADSLARSSATEPTEEAELQGVILGDEVLTPDSSRFWWPQPGPNGEQAQTQWPVGQGPAHPPVSFDKQYVRDWLTGPDSGWDRHSDQSPPPLPEHVVEQTRQRYIEAYERLTGTTFS